MFKIHDDLALFVEENDIYYINFCFFDGHRRVITMSAKEYVQTKPDIIVRSYGKDLLLKPDLSTSHRELHCAYPALAILCTAVDGYESRTTALKAASIYFQNLQELTLEMTIKFSVFEDVVYSVDAKKSHFSLIMDEGSDAAKREREYGNHGHRMRDGCGGRYSSQPVDNLFDLRTEIFSNLLKSGLKANSHYHASCPGQCEIRMGRYSVIDACDMFVIAKNVIKGTASSYGKSASFMPKPIKGYCGNSLDIIVHGINNDNIAGIVGHVHSLSAFTAPTINSYRRLKNLDSYIQDLDNGKKLFRFMDASIDPYLALSAVAMAAVTKSNTNTLPKLPKTLSDSLDALENDHDFLLEAFSKCQIDSYIANKRAEVADIESIPCPAEFAHYYSC